MKTLNVDEKQNVRYAIPLWQRDIQILAAIKRTDKRLQPESLPRSEPVAVVGYGPSLRETWQELKKFKYIISCSGAHTFLIERGIIPTWHTAVDPLPQNTVKLIGKPHKDVEYLISSTCHADVFDHLEGYNVRIWHVFANDDESKRFLPKGEWAITGGCDVGLRSITIAKFLGFTDIHIFGLDGSAPVEDTKHAGEHPNKAKAEFKTEYQGRTFLTTPAMLEAAKGIFHELNQLPDVKPTFYGDGLIQHMAKFYERKAAISPIIAFNNPELISKEYIELNAKLHKTNPLYGVGGAKHAETVLKIFESTKATSILDYGCGKGMLAKSIPFPIWEYDPAIPEKAELPKPADIVVCTDVLEHIEPDKINHVLEDLRRCVKKVGYFVIHTGKSSKTLADGRNTHLIQRGRDWWDKLLQKFFDVGTIMEKGVELYIVVGPKTAQGNSSEEVTTIAQDDIALKFYTPTDTTRWRAQTAFTKEPITTEWVRSMKQGEVFYDIGANVGVYTVMAGTKGVKVYAFEPEAENYSMLVKNMDLNGLEANAYCLAMSNETKVGSLFTNPGGAGQSCHSFGKDVSPTLKPLVHGHKQGCMSMSLDDIIKMGLPAPNYLKIDVDGFEHNVVKGADYILKNGLTSLLVEVNPAIEEHKEMVKYLEAAGYEYDSVQVERARRKEGAFKGVAEYIFVKKGSLVKQVPKEESNMYVPDDLDVVIQPEESYLSLPLGHCSPPVESVINAAMELEPFNHLYIENFFAKSDYEKMVKNMPDNYIEIEKSRGTKGYPERFTAIPDSPFWKGIYGQILDNGAFKKALLYKFGIEDKGFTEELLLVRDLPGYKIPPHTDSTSKIITALIYLPEDDSFTREGTSLYKPKEEGFTCKTGKHYRFEDFDKVKTMPFKPNSAFIFARTDNSFHGVEPCEHIRNVLLYVLKAK